MSDALRGTVRPHAGGAASGAGQPGCCLSHSPEVVLYFLSLYSKSQRYFCVFQVEMFTVVVYFWELVPVHFENCCCSLSAAHPLSWSLSQLLWLHLLLLSVTLLHPSFMACYTTNIYHIYRKVYWKGNRKQTGEGREDNENDTVIILGLLYWFCSFWGWLIDLATELLLSNGILLGYQYLKK